MFNEKVSGFFKRRKSIIYISCLPNFIISKSILTVTLLQFLAYDYYFCGIILIIRINCDNYHYFRCICENLIRLFPTRIIISFLIIILQ
jgi:hypothetical protein